jgi:hypothetical protein
VPISDPFIDDLVEHLVACPGSTTLMRHLTEVLLADGHCAAARLLALTALRDDPGDLRLLAALADAGIDVPDTVEEIAALWSHAPAPSGC